MQLCHPATSAGGGLDPLAGGGVNGAIEQISPDTLILAFLSERIQATVPAIQAACRLSRGEVRVRLAHLESLRHVKSRIDMRLVPPARAFLITGEGRRAGEIADVRV